MITQEQEKITRDKHTTVKTNMRKFKQESRTENVKTSKSQYKSIQVKGIKGLKSIKSIKDDITAEDLRTDKKITSCKKNDRQYID